MGWLRRHLSRRIIVVVGTAALAVAVVAMARNIDGAALAEAWSRASQDPLGMLVATAAFGAAFGLRAVAWTRVLPALRPAHSLAAIHLSLGANHVLPLRLGEPLRVLSVVRRAGVPLDAATASTVTLRAADVLAVVGLGLIVAPAAFSGLVGRLGWVAVAVVVAVSVLGWRWLGQVARRESDVRLPDAIALALSTAAWLLESVLVWQAAHWAGIPIGWTDAMFVTTVAVGAQVAAIAPGGFGTYEAAAVAAYVALGHDADSALIAAVTAHALKTAYSLLVGAVALVAPGPGFVGRLRLQATHLTVRPGASRPDAPVVLFMPAHDEEEAVGGCVERVPPSIDGHPVICLVIDDGSTDGTARVAADAGADVISLPANRGLGAAVRVGLGAGVEREAAAVAFCDADGEYPPEQLADLVRPILAGDADYVVGSRFTGRIDHMHPHRRLGNVLLTRALSIIARRRITDGQSGYRAFSAAAAADAEIVHDFNYAQVITLDLLAKGYRYLEVPISYRFRTSGQSFVRLGPYLRNVVPAVYRELNTV